MNNLWPTQAYDIKVATEILDKYRQKNLNSMDMMLDVVVDVKQNGEKSIEVGPSPWMVDLIKFFRKRYGYEHGYAVVNNIMNWYLMKDKTIH